MRHYFIFLIYQVTQSQLIGQLIGELSLYLSLTLLLHSNGDFPGGPGSGKVTHCDTLMQEKRGVTHINMMDLLQQYAIGNGE